MDPDGSGRVLVCGRSKTLAGEGARVLECAGLLSLHEYVCAARPTTFMYGAFWDELTQTLKKADAA